MYAYYGPLACGRSEYAVNYTCDYSGYNILIGKTYNKDNGIPVVETYTLTDDHKAIQTATVTENGVLRSKTAYTYDSYGNVLTEQDYTIPATATISSSKTNTKTAVKAT